MKKNKNSFGRKLFESIIISFLTMVPHAYFAQCTAFHSRTVTAPVLTPMTLLVVDHPLSISLSTATTNVKEQHPIQIIHHKTIQVFIMFYFLYWGLSSWVENPSDVHSPCCIWSDYYGLDSRQECTGYYE
jgi:hypothetical protein